MLLPMKVVDDSGRKFNQNGWVIVNTSTGEADFNQQHEFWEAERQVINHPSWDWHQRSKEMMIA